MNVTVDNVEVLRLGRRYKYKLQTKLSLPSPSWLGRTNLSLARCSACHTAWLQSRHATRMSFQYVLVTSYYFSFFVRLPYLARTNISYAYIRRARADRARVYIMSRTSVSPLRSLHVLTPFTPFTPFGRFSLLKLPSVLTSRRRPRARRIAGAAIARELKSRRSTKRECCWLVTLAILFCSVLRSMRLRRA